MDDGKSIAKFLQRGNMCTVCTFYTHRKHDVNEWIKEVMWQLVLGLWVYCRGFCCFKLFLTNFAKYMQLNWSLMQLGFNLIKSNYFNTFPCWAIRANVKPSGAPIISPDSHEHGQTFWLFIIHKISWYKLAQFRKTRSESYESQTLTSSVFEILQGSLS